MTKEKYLQIREYVSKHQALRFLMGFFATKVVLVYISVGLLMLFWQEGRSFAVLGGVSLVLGWGVLVHAISFIFPSKRPYQKYGFVPIAGLGLFSSPKRSSDSFPSGHVTAIATLTTLFYFFANFIFWISLVILVLNIASRTALGFHWFRDSVCGSILGLIIGMLVWVYRDWVLSVFGVIW